MTKQLIMKFSFLILMIMLCISCNCINGGEMQKDTTILGKGELITQNFSGEAWLKMFSIDKKFDCSVYNVTFAPSVRNDWHIHSVGQILLCIDGEGIYQEKGKNAQILKIGDVINIPANTEHWHGATPNSQFTHIGITPKISVNKAEWRLPVTEKEYLQAAATKQ